MYDVFIFFFQAEDGIRDLVRSRGLGDVYKRQILDGISFVFQIDEQLKTNSWAKIFEVLFEKSIFDNQLFISSWISKQAVSYTHLTLPTSDLV